MRLKAYRIDCDKCFASITATTAKEAEFQARRQGWALNTKHEDRRADLCDRCRKYHR